MTPERWQIIKPILEEALELPPESRHDFLKRSCDDDALLREAESLLKFEGSDADLLEESAFSIVNENDAAKPASSFIGDQIGKYEIISELGVGGMGAVFLAKRADGEFHRQVALKLIKSGIGSDSILRRFYGERQILASLDHPNIAHLIDGGTTADGLPYFVMEYVKGETIIEFARNLDLSLEDRLDLFIEICAAVSFAHQNLVIHRDLKPSNIVVNDDGIPKLLDFGIAKLLKPENTNDTRTQHFVFTPEYASPEQIRGENLTTATDIYSLGVILYELLTNVRPFSFKGKDFGQIIQTATRTEPTRPSTVISSSLSFNENLTDEEVKQRANRYRQFTRSLRGDLDNIILKALKKEPGRRYLTVEQLSDDIRRHLKGLPVLARQDTWRYRVEKFVRRNPVVVGATALAFLILIVGIFATAYQARQANIQREKAERRFNDVRSLVNSFVFEINDEIDKSPIKARELIVQRGIEYLDDLARESVGDMSLQSELAAAYEKIGDVQSEIFKPNLGNSGGALESQNKALQLRQVLFDKDPESIQLGLDLAKSHQKVGNILSATGDINLAYENYQNAVALSEQMAAAAPQDEDIKKQLSNSYIMLGQAILHSGSLSDSLRNYEKAFEIDGQLILDHPTNEDLRRRQSVEYSYIGYVRTLMGNFDQAVLDFEKALVIEQHFLETNPTNLRARRSVSIAYLWAGIGYREAGRSAESLANIKKALELQQGLFDSDKQNYGEQNALADCFLELGMALTKAGKLSEAIDSFQKAVGHYSTVGAADSDNLSVQRQIHFAQRHMADALVLKGNSREALRKYEESLAVFMELTARDPRNLEWTYDVAICHLRISKLMRMQMDNARAVASLQNALPILENLVSKSPGNINHKTDLAETRSQLTHLLSN